MNFAAHASIALASGALPVDPFDDRSVRLVLGAALPDWSAMGHFRLRERPDDRLIRRGVDLHHRTDGVFHRNPWFLELSKAASTMMESNGLSRGAARGCGHVGVELLLDGFLLANDRDLGNTVNAALTRLGDRDIDLESLVSTEKRADWRQHLDRLASWSVPDDYRDPDAVAKRLWHILARRRRLAFERGETLNVSLVLQRLQPELEATATDLLDELLSQLEAARIDPESS